MEGWILFWKFVVILTIVVYFPMALVVTIFGVRDIRNLFRDMLADKTQKQEK